MLAHLVRFMSSGLFAGSLSQPDTALSLGRFCMSSSDAFDGKPIESKSGKSGPFWVCSQYPGFEAFCWSSSCMPLSMLLISFTVRSWPGLTCRQGPTMPSVPSFPSQNGPLRPTKVRVKADASPVHGESVGGPLLGESTASAVAPETVNVSRRALLYHVRERASAARWGRGCGRASPASGGARA